MSRPLTAMTAFLPTELSQAARREGGRRSVHVAVTMRSTVRVTDRLVQDMDHLVTIEAAYDGGGDREKDHVPCSSTSSVTSSRSPRPATSPAPPRPCM